MGRLAGVWFSLWRLALSRFPRHPYFLLSLSYFSLDPYQTGQVSFFQAMSQNASS